MFRIIGSIAGLSSEFAINGDAQRGGEIELVLDEVEHVHQEPLRGDHVPVVVKGELGREHGVLDERRSVWGGLPIILFHSTVIEEYFRREDKWFGLTRFKTSFCAIELFLATNRSRGSCPGS